MRTNKEKPKVAFVEARRIHPSKLLPTRELDPKLEESIRKYGIQQPLIVRRSPHKKGMYEIIDGHLRHKSVKGNKKMLVVVRYDISDADVFKISEATFKRKQRNTYERAQFYKGWVKTVEAKHGSRGAQAKVASMANISEAGVSHYLSINRLFERLQSQNISERIFDALQNQSVNKLYALAKVKDNSAILEIAAKMVETDMSLNELMDLIEEQTSPLRALIEEDEEAESESTEIGDLTSAAQELEVALDKAREVLMVFTSRIVVNPRRYVSPGIFKRIRTMLKALKKIEKEANRIIRSEKQAGA